MKVRIKNINVEADMADTSWKRMIGLSFSKNKNMLFEMVYESRWSFWMFGVRYPLNIFFIDRNKMVVDIKRAEPLSLDPRTWRTYSPKEPCKYVFETPFELKIKIGDKLNW
jgi:uncharacterized membrane protein (UPF0127 family)